MRPFGLNVADDRLMGIRPAERLDAGKPAQTGTGTVRSDHQIGPEVSAATQAQARATGFHGEAVYRFTLHQPCRAKTIPQRIEQHIVSDDVTEFRQRRRGRVKAQR